MLQFVDLALDGYLTYIDDGAPDTRVRVDREFPLFVSTVKSDWRKKETCEGFRSFAESFGPVLGDLLAFPFPEGLGSFRDDAAKARERSCDGLLYCEPLDKLRFHAKTLRDLALLHTFYYSVSDRTRVVGSRLLWDNLVSFRDPRTGLMAYLYRATAGSEPTARYSLPLDASCLPPDVAGLLDVLGGPFWLSSLHCCEEDTLSSRAEWLADNYEAIVSAFLPYYRMGFPGAAGSLLSGLQEDAARLLSGTRPLQFCVLCGGAAVDVPNAYTTSFDTTACRFALIRHKEECAEMLQEVCRCGPDEAAAMLDTSRKSFKTIKSGR